MDNGHINNGQINNGHINNGHINNGHINNGHKGWCEGPPHFFTQSTKIMTDYI